VIDLSRVGELARPDGEGRAGGGLCDDRVRFTLAVDPAGRLPRVRFGVDACPATTAAAAWLAATAEGRPLLEAARLGVAAATAGAAVEPARRGCVHVAVDALHAALGDAVVRGARLPPALGGWRSRCPAASTRPSRWPRAWPAGRRRWA
jgi:NifU-like protein involved in Fe-S cluster formation